MTAKSFFSKIFTVTTIIILAITLCIPMAEEVHAAPKKVKVTFNVNGGKALPKAKRTKSITAGKKVGTLPKATRTGYTLKGWYTKKSGGKKISKNTQIKKKTTYYARWTAKSYNVKFDANGGTTPTMQSKKVKYKSKYGKLATTSRVGHDFQGWYTAKTGGKKITANDIHLVASHSTLYAQWTTTKNPTAVYELTLLSITDDAIEEGRRTYEITGPGFYQPGTTVWITVKPYGSIDTTRNFWWHASGDDSSITGWYDGCSQGKHLYQENTKTYRFSVTMPEENVKVECGWSQ